MFEKKLTKLLNAAPGPISLIFSLATVAYFSLTWILFFSQSECSGGADCVKYLDMADAFVTGKFQPVDHPFHLRVLAPWLASFSPYGSSTGFQLVNMAAEIAFVYFWYKIAQELQFGNLEFATLVLWFFLHPLGFALYATLPASVDPISYALISIVTFLFLKKESFVLSVVLFISLLAKESFVFIAAIIMVSELIFAVLSRNESRMTALKSVGYILSALFFYSYVKDYMVTHVFPQRQPWTITIADTLAWWMAEVIREPARILVWVSSFFCSAGLFPVFLTKKFFLVKDPLTVRLVSYFTLGALGFFMLGILGGSDMSRIIFNGNFFIITLMILAFKQGKFPMSALVTTMVVSIAGSYFYTTFFPANFEYDYYLHGKRIIPTIVYLTVNLIALFFLHLFFNKQFKLSN